MKDELKIGLIIAVATVLLSGIVSWALSSTIADDALDVAKEANRLADEANKHTKNIEEATLQVGHVKYTNNALFVSVINGYYARYPAYVVSATVCFLDSCNYVKVNPEEDEWKLIDRDKPAIVTIPFNESRVVGIPDGTNNISVEIRYVDFGEMNLKSITATYEINFSENNITYANLIGVKRDVIRTIET